MSGAVEWLSKGQSLGWSNFFVSRDALPEGDFWTHDLSPFLVQFPEGWPVDGIRYYGLAYLLGFVLAGLLLWLYWRRGRSPLGSERIFDLMTYIVLGVMIGGRLGYMLLYDLGDFLANPLIFFRVWEGGMASHGGILGVAAAVVLFAWRHRVDFPFLGDLIVASAPIGLLLGRLANFINGELWGRPAKVAWAVIFPDSQPVFVRELGRAVLYPRHPSQLYAAFLEGLLPLLYLQARFWLSSPEKLRAGRLAGEFFCLYALVRIFGELFREPDASLILGMSRGQFYSIFLFLGGLALILWSRHRLSHSEAIAAVPPS
ncbi:MAG: prolipoprotein diacylglyceryl transferase [Verrucomicrobiota bacterium]